MSLQLNRRRLLRGASSIAAVTLAAPWVARAGGLLRTVRIGTVNPPASATGQACKAFADAVAAAPALSSVLQVEVIAGGSLGGELEMTQACINGSLDLAVTATNVVASIVPELGLLDAPFLFRDAVHARAVLDGPVGAEFAELLKAKGALNIAWAENGLRHVTGNRPVRKPDDLHGLHIRVPQSQVMIDAFRALGANAEPLPFPQLFDALRTGQFDAQENPVATIVAANFQKVQKYLSLTGHVYSAAFFIVSPDLLEDLQPAQRSALIDAARIGGKASRDAASKGEHDGIGTLGQGGMTVIQDVDRAALAEAARPALNAVATKLGPERAARIRDFTA